MRLIIGAIFLVTVPATIITSDCLGDGLKASSRNADIQNNVSDHHSKAQQAKPKVTGQIEYFRPQLTISPGQA
jgi:hypothetical protein